MGFWAIGGKVVKTCADVKSWVSYDTLKGGTRTLVNHAKVLVTPQKASRKETFDEAVQRLDLNDEDVNLLAKRFLYHTYLYLAVTICIILYMLYLFWEVKIIPGCLAILLSILSMTKAFEAHFRYFQISNRKLGCTIKEWFQGHVEENS